MDLTGFDPSTMTYLATQMQHPNVGAGHEAFQDMLLSADYPSDHHSHYGGYAGSEDLNLQGLHAQQRYIKPFAASVCEEPFSDVVSAFDNPLHYESYEPHDPNDPDSPSIDRDDKLLAFTIPSFDYTLLDYSYRRTALSLQAHLHGMFFLAESPWATAGDANPPPSELTCYRRNLFQITGEITLPRALRYIMTEQGDQIPIIGQELVISATESTEGNSVKIISVPWKTPANPNIPIPEDKVEREPHSIPLDLMSVPDMSADFATIPFQWKRLQFRIATANNGRRKELQQHFVVRLKVLATLATGGKVSICEVKSGAIIVRGRSPRNFQSRKDMPLNGGGHARKPSNLPGQSRAATVAGGEKLRNDAPTSAPVKTENPAQSVAMKSLLDGNEDGGARKDGFDWAQVHAGGAGNEVSQPRATPPNFGLADDNFSPEQPRSAQKSHTLPPFAPINLSLVEDDSPQPGNSATPPDGRTIKRLQIPPRPPSFTLHVVNSPDESADLLYEYFPLGLDDWMPPVDAVYRPHVVHHTKLPTDPRDPNQTARGKSKRYFSEDVS